MRKSDLKQISDLMDQKFDEKLVGFATKDDLKQFATKEDLKQFATKKDLDASEERIILTVYKNFKEFEEKADIKFDKISKELSQRPTKDEIFQKWDNDIDQIRCDVDGLKFIHRDQWKQLPDRATIKNALNEAHI